MGKAFKDFAEVAGLRLRFHRLNLIRVRLRAFAVRGCTSHDESLLIESGTYSALVLSSGFAWAASIASHGESASTSTVSHTSQCRFTANLITHLRQRFPDRKQFGWLGQSPRWSASSGASVIRRSPPT